MKRTATIVLFQFVLIAVFGQSAHVLPLNLSSISGVPWFISAPDHNVLLVGMQGYTNPGFGNSKIVLHSNNGGQTFETDTIPELLNRGVSGVWAIDSLTFYVALSDWDYHNGGTVWKTTDGGHNWIETNVGNQFPTTYLDYVAFFSRDTGVAIGDPLGGYFEIYTTDDGGANWNQVSTGNMPPVLNGETGLYGNRFTTVGDRIWIPTTKGRTFFSFDRGHHWRVATVSSDPSVMWLDMSMNDSLNGAALQAPFSSSIFLTTDGGFTWTSQTMPSLFYPERIAAVKSFPGVYVYGSLADGIYATADNFQTSYLINNSITNMGCNLYVMVDQNLGYSDIFDYHSDSSLVKIEGVTTDIGNEPSGLQLKKLSVFPNPVVAGHSLVTFSSELKGEAQLSLFDFSGKNIRNREIAIVAGNNSLVYDFAGVPAGDYILNISVNGNSTSIKIQIQ